MAWSLAKNPLSQFDKSSVYINTDSYIDLAVRAVFDVNKMFSEPGHNIREAVMMKILTVDQLETVMIGLGKARKGVDEDGKTNHYQSELDRAAELIKSENFEDSGELKASIMRDVKWANYKFQILLSALSQSRTKTVELKG